MPRRTINFTDLGVSPEDFEDSDRPNGNLLQGIGEIFRQHRDLLTDAQWNEKRGDFLPSDADRDFIESLMQPESEPGKFANWIAPPKVGIDNKPGDFEYVKIET